MAVETMVASRAIMKLDAITAASTSGRRVVVEDIQMFLGKLRLSLPEKGRRR
jgi:hypothetical protein